MKKKNVKIIVIVVMVLTAIIARPIVGATITPTNIILVDSTGKRIEIKDSDKESISKIIRNRVFLNRQILRWFMDKTDWQFPDYARTEYLEITTFLGIKYHIYWWYEMGGLIECSLLNTYSCLREPDNTQFQKIVRQYNVY